MNDNNTNYGLCWFQPDQWDRLIEISSDRNDLDDSYQQWRSNAHRAIRELQDSGITVKKVKVNLEELLSWCNEKGIPVNGKSRSEYVSYLMSNKAQRFNKS